MGVMRKSQKNLEKMMTENSMSGSCFAPSHHEPWWHGVVQEMAAIRLEK